MDSHPVLAQQRLQKVMEIETSIPVDLQGNPDGKKKQDTGSVVYVFLSDDLLGEQEKIQCVVLKENNCVEGNGNNNKVRSLG